MQPVIIKSKRGNTATLYHGDCMEILPQLATPNDFSYPDQFGLPDKKLAVITDPPYEHPKMGGGQGCFGDSMRKIKGSELARLSTSFDIKDSARLWLALGAETFVCFCSNKQTRHLENHFEDDLEMNCTKLVWWKYNAIPAKNNTWWPNAEYIVHARQKGATFRDDPATNGGLPTEWFSRVIKAPMVSAEDGNGEGGGLHPTAKHVWMMQRFIEICTSPGDTVVDPFMGGGATGVAAMLSGRNFVGIELMPDYFETSRKKIGVAADQGGIWG
jgi:DNA modification methylase